MAAICSAGVGSGSPAIHASISRVTSAGQSAGLVWRGRPHPACTQRCWVAVPVLVKPSGVLGQVHTSGSLTCGSAMVRAGLSAGVSAWSSSSPASTRATHGPQNGWGAVPSPT